MPSSAVAVTCSVRSISPALTRKTSDIATCPITSRLRRPKRPGLRPAAPVTVLSDGARLGFDASNAGANPNTTLVAIDRRTANNMTR